MLSGMRQRKVRRLETGCLLEVYSKQISRSFPIAVVRMTKPMATFDVERGVTKKDDEQTHHLFCVIFYCLVLVLYVRDHASCVS